MDGLGALPNLTLKRTSVPYFSTAAPLVDCDCSSEREMSVRSLHDSIPTPSSDISSFRNVE